MPENERCLFKISIFYEMAVTKKTMKMNVGYMCYVIASNFKKRIKHPPGHAPCDGHKISDRRKSDQWIPAVFFCAIKKVLFFIASFSHLRHVKSYSYNYPVNSEA